MAEQNSPGRPEINVQPLGVTSGRYHLPHIATTLVANNECDDNVGRYSLAIGGILSIAKERSAVAHAIRALLWICGDVKHSHFQDCSNDTKYIELCPSYIATVDGVTRWAARQAWDVCSALIGWSEVSRDTAIAFGADIRSIQYGQRWGRHVLFNKEQYSLLKSAAHQARESGLLSGYYENIQSEKTCTIHLPSDVWSGNRRTIAVSCPHHHNHKKGDKNPSLILWRPDSNGRGGAMCMVCKDKDGNPLTMSAYHRGNKVILRSKSEHGSHHTKPVLHHRHNKYPIGGSIGPVGGRVASSGGGVFIGAKLATRGSRTARSVGSRLSGDPIRVLKWSDSRSRGKTESERAAFIRYMSDGTNELSEQFETPLCSVSSMSPSVWHDYGGRSIPGGWKSTHQAWVLFDVDDVYGVVDHQRMLQMISSRIEKQSDLSGRFAVVQTGPVGYQVWAELREVRHSPEQWHRSPEVIQWYRRIGQGFVADISLCGGYSHKLDMSSCAAGRFGRRPCWRMMEDGSVFRSKLLFACEQRTDGRQPRGL